MIITEKDRENVRNFYYSIRRVIIGMFTDKRYFYYLYRDIKQIIFNLYYWFKPISKTYYWDYGYLIDIEKHQLKQMLKYFIKSDLVENNDIIVRDIKICLSLIDIIKNEAEDISYVNIKNYKRFIPSLNNDMLDPLIRDVDTVKMVSRWIAQEKAFHLYNKIRAYRMQTWWD